MNATPVLTINPQVDENYLSLPKFTDLEAQHKSDLVLKSILKNSEYDIKSEIKISLLIKKITAVSFVLLLNIPIIVCDLYFGFNDTSCVNEKSRKFDFDVKLYLLMCGFMGLFSLLASILSIYSIDFISEKNEKIILEIKYLAGFIVLFSVIWNNIGAIIFWLKKYPKKICNENVSMYVFISLIFKFINNCSNFSRLNSNKKN